MRSANQQRAVKLAVSGVVVVLGIAAIGCERRQADVSAVTLMRKGDSIGAAKEKQASPAIAAIAAGRAADDKFTQSFQTYAKLSQTDLAINESLWSLSRISLQTGSIYASGASLSGYNPQQSLASLDKTVQEVKGDGQPTWTPTEGIALPSASSATNATNKLKDQIAESERHLASLVQKRDAANQDAQRLLDQSLAATGEKGIELLKKTADARKLATETQAQIDAAETAQLALKQQLSVAVAQNQTASQTVEVLAGLRESIEKSWRNIATHADQRMAAATALFGKTGDKSGTVLAAAGKVIDLYGEQQKQLSEYEQQLQEADTFAKDAVSNAEKALRESKASGPAAKGPSPAAALASAMDPSMNRFVQAHIEYSLGTAEGDQAILLNHRAAIAALVADVAKSVNQKAPEGFDVATIGTWREAAVAKAGESLKSAGELFTTVGDAPAALASVRTAAKCGQINVLHASAMIAPDAATAKGYIDQAKALRDAQIQAGEKLPSLPPSLQGGLPAAPAAPAGNVER